MPSVEVLLAHHGDEDIESLEKSIDIVQETLAGSETGKVFVILEEAYLTSNEVKTAEYLISQGVGVYPVY